MRIQHLVAGLFLGLILADAASAQETQWRAPLSAEQIAAAYPAKVGDRYPTGSATLACPISVEGTTGNCRLVSQSPAGAGFGEAALKLTSSLRATHPSPSHLGMVLTLKFVFAPDASGAPGVSILTIKPAWLEKPTARDVERHYPKTALAHGVSGRAFIRCVVVGETGRIKDCILVGETPPGWGFGEAGLALTPLFRMRAPKDGDAPVDGATVSVPIVFLVD